MSRYIKEIETTSLEPPENTMIKLKKTSNKRKKAAKNKANLAGQSETSE